MEKSKLTSRQEQALEIIKDFQALNGYAPSNRELCKAMGLQSSSTAHGIIKRLQKKGYITKEINTPRAMRVTEINQDDEITRLRRRVADLEEQLRQQRPDILTIGKHDASLKAVIAETRMAVGD